MPYAQIAAQYITAWCRATYAKDPDKMGSTMANGGMIDCFDHRGHGSHKYIPADKLTEDLGERQHQEHRHHRQSEAEDDGPEIEAETSQRSGRFTHERSLPVSPSS